MSGNVSGEPRREDVETARASGRGTRAVGSVALAAVLILIATGAVRVFMTDDDAFVAPSSAPTVAAAPTVPAPQLTEVDLVDVDTGEPTPLPASITSIATGWYEVAPGGDQIAFVGDVEGPQPPQVFVARLDGSEVRQVTSGRHLATSPSWFPEGKRLVYVRGLGSERRLMIVRIADGRTSKIDTSHGPTRWIEPIPDVGADGRSILFTSTIHGGRDVGLWTVAVGGGPARLLMDGAGFGAFSPDGSTIAYHEMGNAVSERVWPMDMGIWLADADGSNRRRLLGSNGHLMAPAEWSSTRPAWSPDGRRIAFAPIPEPRGEIVTVEVGVRHPYFLESVLNGAPHRHAGIVAAGSMPSWADRGTLIVPELA